MEHPHTKTQPDVLLDSPATARNSIHVLFAKSNGAAVVRWLREMPEPPDNDLLKYIWVQSIRSNQTECVFDWMQEHRPNALAAFNAHLDASKLLSSPRTWLSLKKQNLIPTLTSQQVASITAAWNRTIFDIAGQFKESHTWQKYKAYFVQCVQIQLDFLSHYVPSYRKKMHLLTIVKNRYTNHNKTLPNNRATDPNAVLLRFRGAAMAESQHPDMWLLACMAEENLALSYHVSNSPRVSTWWQPLLAQLYPKKLQAGENWHRDISQTTEKDRPVPTAITMACHLTAGIPNINDCLTAILAVADSVQEKTLDVLDLSAIAFEME